MKKKSLAINILLALSATAFMPMGAWAAEWPNPDEYKVKDTEQGKQITITTSNTVATDSTFNGEGLDSFKTVVINYTPTADAGGNRALGIYSARYNFEDTDFIVNVSGENGNSNNDGLHLTNWGPRFIVNNFTAKIEADSSDALNLSHDVGSDGGQQMGSIAEIKGHLFAEIAHGNGIRANAPTREGITNTLSVDKGTEITLNGGSVTQKVTLSDAQLDALLGDKKILGLLPARDQVKSMSATATYNPAAIYAGNDMYRFTCNLTEVAEKSGVLDKFEGQADTIKQILNSIGDLTMGDESKGNGIINLNGTTILHLNGENNYGLFAGKNGVINVQGDINIDAHRANSYGIAATNGNLIYGGNAITAEAQLDSLAAKLLGEEPITADLEVVLDQSKNTHGTAITLGENTNVVINMNGIDSYAIYASGVDDTAEHKQNSVTSEGTGLDYVDIMGDIAAEEGGLIDLHMTGNQSWIKGNITAQGMGSNVSTFSSTDDTKAATVNIKVDNALSGKGTLAAANGGAVNVELGAYSNWTGRADDYQDAGTAGWDHATIENVFDKNTKIEDKGTVNLTLGKEATWNVTGQSWITKLTGNDSIIQMDGDNTGGHALHVGTLEGTNTFVMNVRPDETGDMLYVKDGSQAGTQNLMINNRDEVLENMNVGDKVRFATVANAGGGFTDGEISGGAAQTFGRSTRISDAGVFNVDFDIEYHTYGKDVTGDVAGEDAEKANGVYNGGAEFDTAKPGSDYVDENYGQGTGQTEGQSLAIANGVENTTESSSAKNVYLVRKNATMDNMSDAGKTVVAMSRINYSNAIYMDRLNKRMGEARYIDGDEGLWVRMRHDRIGKSDAFRSKNTMFELGYDRKVGDREDGEHRQGVVFDYMRGTANYDNVAGDGDVRRGGIWLYDTWLGNKGHYTDYVLKFGRLSNDFEIYARSTGEKITGDYSNFVYSASAEYGRKKDLGNNWYIEPQAQIQYAHVTDADYTTSQDTHVQLDAIDSLIGRVGFRLGKDVGEKSTFYIKADVLHEFLGDQDIEARDATGLLSTTYENEGTWYDIGLGFSHQFSKGTYMYLDMEKSIGNDNEDTYQFNVGMNWKV